MNFKKWKLTSLRERNCEDLYSGMICIFSAMYHDIENVKDIASITIGKTSPADIAYDWGAKVLYFLDRLSQPTRIRALNMEKRSLFHLKRYKAEVSDVGATDDKVANIRNMAVDVTKRLPGLRMNVVST